MTFEIKIIYSYISLTSGGTNLKQSNFQRREANILKVNAFFAMKNEKKNEYNGTSNVHVRINKVSVFISKKFI